MTHDHHHELRYHYCPNCGDTLVRRRVQARDRSVCDNCGFIHYRNPPVAVMTVVRSNDRVVLVRRAAGLTGAGRWSLPGGFIDHDEDIRDAAKRELKEETGLSATAFRVIDVATSGADPLKPTLVVWFAAETQESNLIAGDDADQARWFPLGELPPMAFSGDVTILTRMSEGLYPFAADRTS